MFLHGREAQGQDTNLTATISGCDFIDNEGFRGGAAYLRSSDLVEFKDCKFISNHSNAGGGALCMSDKDDIETTEVLICNSDFIGNTADDKGGAVYNRGGASTTMVNCIVAGNTADSLGGGTCNADDFSPPPVATTTFDLHNCLLAGNLADTPGNVGGGHLNRDGGVSTLINCTVVLNEAYADFGGIENLDADSTLKVQNCIVWGNEDGAPNGADDQVHYTAGFNPGDVDKSVIEDCDDCFAGGENKDVDPVVVNIIASPTWVDCTYDADTGITTFEMTVEVSAPLNESLFQPDGDSPLQVLIESVDTEDDLIRCYGNWTDLHSFQTKTGTIYDYHIDTGSSAIDYGDVTYLADATGAGDDCDLNNNQSTTDDLPQDLDGNARSQGDPATPESGAYEVE